MSSEKIFSPPADRFERLKEDAAKAFQMGLPIKKKQCVTVNEVADGEFCVCALGAAYVFHNGLPACGSIGTDIVADWASSNYGFLQTEIAGLMRGFDGREPILFCAGAYENAYEAGKALWEELP